MLPPGGLATNEANHRYRNVIIVLTVAVAAVASLGTWTYSRVHASLRDVRTAGLTTLLDAESRVAQIWIEEKKRDAERWASTPEVQRVAASLARLAAGGAAPGALCAAPAQRALHDEIGPYAVLEESVAYNLITKDAAIVAAQFTPNCGRRIESAAFMRRLAPVFAGRTVFIPPWRESDRLGERHGPLQQPLVWIETPVRGEGGEVVAALGFGRDAEQRFGKLLVLSGNPSSREAFAFDVQGAMLTESRTAAGRERLAHTALVRAAVAARRSGEGLAGTILEPYESYRGATVIGAWRWLPEEEMAIAVEIEAADAYAPLRYLQLAFGALFAFALASLLAAAVMSVWAVRVSVREARRIGQYEIEREIGEGGMSRVFLVRHPHLKRPTAVKVLKPHLATDEVVARFEREVQLCSRLTHPNTIAIYDYGRTRDGTFYYAMEHLDGISLQDLIERDGPMPVSRTIHALRQACGSLREAHAQGLVHRDIKPANLMLCRHGGEHDVLKVLDFGLVKETLNPQTRDITQYAKMLGTPLYMAPERLRDPADADARADIYALGAVAFFLLTGRKLFETATEHDLVYRALNEPAPSPTACGARDVPAVLESLIARCLAKDRADRPQSVDELEAVLSEVARLRPWTEDQARSWWSARKEP